jgi:hypothetical protein
MLDDFGAAFPDSSVKRKRSRHRGVSAATTASGIASANEEDSENQLAPARASNVIADADRRIDEQGTHLLLLVQNE